MSAKVNMFHSGALHHDTNKGFHFLLSIRLSSWHAANCWAARPAFYCLLSSAFRLCYKINNQANDACNYEYAEPHADFKDIGNSMA